MGAYLSNTLLVLLCALFGLLCGLTASVVRYTRSIHLDVRTMLLAQAEPASAGLLSAEPDDYPHSPGLMPLGDLKLGPAAPTDER